MNIHTLMICHKWDSFFVVVELFELLIYFPPLFSSILHNPGYKEMQQGCTQRVLQTQNDTSPG